MKKQEEERFLRNGRILRLASLHEDGSPHLVPVWYIYEDGRLYVATSDTSRKARNIKKSGRVAFCVDVGEGYEDLKAVIGKGNARVITDSNVVEDKGKKILLKYLGDLNHPVAKELAKADNCVIEISPTWTRSWDYST